MKQYSIGPTQIYIPETIIEKSQGLIAKENLLSNGCMLLLRCNWVHSFFLGVPIKLYFLDNSFNVVSRVENFVPNRFSPFKFKALHTLETSTTITDEEVSSLLTFFQQTLST